MGKRILLLSLLNCAFVLSRSNVTLAQQAEAARMEAVDRFIEAQMRKQNIPGVSLAVVKDGELILTRGYGLADVELNVAATPQTVYQIQSITKPFVASAMMMLEREKKLSLDDELGKYLEGVPEGWKGITIRRILNHTSGIKDYINEPFASLRIDISDEEVLRETAKRPLNFRPGERYAYCNTGYLLAGMIIRKITGKHYGEFLQERIFGPLGMTQTRVQQIDEIIPRRASGYRLIDGKLRKGEYVAQSILSYPGGGILSTALDMAKFDLMWQGGKIVDDSVRREMWTTGLLNDGSRTGYGLGFGIGDLRGWRMIGHGGGHVTGFGTKYVCFPQRRLSVIVLTNQNNCNTDVLAHGVAGLVDEALLPQAMMKERAETDAKVAEELVKAVAALAGKGPDEQLVTEALRKAITDQTREMLSSALPTIETMKYQGSDDVRVKAISGYGVPTAELRYYRMKNEQKMRYFKFYLTADGRLAGLTCWDEQE
jgi:D-alanyl-D-alanine carboxypeptidase